MSSILDIDLDFFKAVKDPVVYLEKLLRWAGRPVDVLVEKHHEAFARWKSRVRQGALASPLYILHVDEHHDMMDENRSSNIANFMYHAMRTWPACRVHWLVEHPIDSPRMWLSDDVWHGLAGRFSLGPCRPRGWPKPNLVSVCTSPEFVAEGLRRRLLRAVHESMKVKRLCVRGKREAAEESLAAECFSASLQAIRRTEMLNRRPVGRGSPSGARRSGGDRRESNTGSEATEASEGRRVE